MAFIVQTKPDIGDATRQEDLGTVIDNVNDLNSRVANTESGKSEIINGSFELFDDESQPVGWEVIVAAGNSGGVVTSGTETRHGQYAYKARNTAGATGGVELITEDFVPIGESLKLNLNWFMKISASGSLNTIAINYYEYDKSTLVSSDTLYSYSGVAIDWNYFSYDSIVPSGSRFCKVDAMLLNNSTIADTYIDGFELNANTNLPSVEIFSASSGTYAIPNYVNSLVMELQAGGAGGGGGGGSNIPTYTYYPGGGGGGGGYAKYYLTDIPSYSVATIVIGAGGAAGGGNQTGNGGNGSAGGDTVVYLNGVTYTVAGGSGGAGGNPGTGGVGGVVANGTNKLGISGGAGSNKTADTNASAGGCGGQSYFGRGTSVGDAVGYGAGGTGGNPWGNGKVGTSGIAIFSNFQ